VVLAVIAVLIGLLFPALAGARRSARMTKDATQIRSIQQALAVWAQQNREEYPLPSKLDKADRTVTAPAPWQKDNTGNILSILVFNKSLPPSVLISPAEANPNVAVDDGYQFDSPAQAEQPEDALWDPGFAGVLNDNGTAIGKGRRSTRANTSYATVPPFGARRDMWKLTVSPKEVVVGNRGPQWGGSAGDWELAPPPFGEGSYTLRIHGGDKTWEGCLAFNDGRVEKVERPDPDSVKFHFTGMGTGGTLLNDNVFVNENDATGAFGLEARPAEGANALLRGYKNVRGTDAASAQVTTVPD